MCCSGFVLGGKLFWICLFGKIVSGKMYSGNFVSGISLLDFVVGKMFRAKFVLEDLSKTNFPEKNGPKQMFQNKIQKQIQNKTINNPKQIHKNIFQKKNQSNYMIAYAFNEVWQSSISSSASATRRHMRRGTYWRNFVPAGRIFRRFSNFQFSSKILFVGGSRWEIRGRR